MTSGYFPLIVDPISGDPQVVQHSRSICCDCEKKNGTIMGHLPRRLSTECPFFLQRGGTISCTVTEGRRYSVDLYIALNLPLCTVHKGAHDVFVP